MLALVALPAGAGAARWSASVRLLGPTPLDVTGPQLALAPGGGAVLAAGFLDADRPRSAHSSVAWLKAGGLSGGSQSMPGTRLVLDVGYFDGTLYVLAGTSGGGRACCTNLEALSLGRRGFGRPHTLARGQLGAAAGQLVPGPRGLLALVASGAGVWAAQAPAHRGLGPARRLTPAGVAAASLTGLLLRGGRTLAAWATADPQPGDPASTQSIVVAAGASARVPSSPRVVWTAPAGQQLSDLAAALTAGPPTLAWIENYNDTSYAYHAQVVALDLTSAPRARVFALPGLSAAGLSLAADAGGDQVLAWRACDLMWGCRVEVASRKARGSFGSPVALGAIDPGADPAVAVGPRGEAVVGWVAGGRVTTVTRPSEGRRFGGLVRLAGGGSASGLSLAAEPDGRIVAAWVDGSAAPAIYAAERFPR